MNERKITIALAGNPNCGKTTLFNALTGANQTIGNWPGVTVEKLEGQYSYKHDNQHHHHSKHHHPGGPHHGPRDPHYHTDSTRVSVVDLPGIYSLAANSEDEKAARDYLLTNKVDLILNIVDATNLERNLYLTIQLLEMGLPVIVLLNMMDLAEKRSIEIDQDHLSIHLGVPVMGISALDKKDVDGLKVTVNELSLESPISNLKVAYPNEIDDILNSWEPLLHSTAAKINADSRWFSLRLLEDDELIVKMVRQEDVITLEEVSENRSRVESLLNESMDVIAADYRFGVAKSITKEVVKLIKPRQSKSDNFDNVVMNRFLGVPLFLGVMFLVFWVTINLGTAFADFFDILFGTILVDGSAALLYKINAPEWITFIVSGGIGSGIQAVATFVPFIFFMFFMLSLLEDSGYMARAAFVMDRFMGVIGLPGKAFVPMLVGFGCTVPAIMATRTLDTRRDRLMTIFMVPLMSCGARLPVYALFAAAFFGKASGTVVFSLYIIGILLAVFTGFLVRDSLFKGETSHLIMELPHYHSPRMRHILLHTWSRLKDFILRAGKIIIFATIILGLFSSLGVNGTFGNEESDQSILAATGRVITPVFTPMGIEKDNWPATVGLFTGVFAKEAIVATLSALYGQSAAASDALDGLSSATENVNFTEGTFEAFRSIPAGLAVAFGLGDAEEEDTELFQSLKANFTPAGAYAYLLFVLIYFPCMAALAAAWRSMGPMLAILQAFYLTILAWAISTLFFQIAQGHNPIFIIIPVMILAGIVITSRIVGRKRIT